MLGGKGRKRYGRKLFVGIAPDASGMGSSVYLVNLSLLEHSSNIIYFNARQSSCLINSKMFQIHFVRLMEVKG